jgi:hypothetical protein
VSDKIKGFFSSAEQDSICYPGIFAGEEIRSGFDEIDFAGQGKSFPLSMYIMSLQVAAKPVMQQGTFRQTASQYLHASMRCYLHSNKRTKI